MSLTIATLAATALAEALATELGANAVLEIRSGGAPGPDNAATGTLLVSITIPGSWTATNNAISATSPAEQLPTAAGTAGHFRLKTSGGTAVLEGSVSALGGGGDLQLTSTTIQTGLPVDLGTPSFTVPLT